MELSNLSEPLDDNDEFADLVQVDGIGTMRRDQALKRAVEILDDIRDRLDTASDIPLGHYSLLQAYCEATTL